MANVQQITALCKLQTKKDHAKMPKSLVKSVLELLCFKLFE